MCSLGEKRTKKKKCIKAVFCDLPLFIIHPSCTPASPNEWKYSVFLKIGSKYILTYVSFSLITFSQVDGNTRLKFITDYPSLSWSNFIYSNFTSTPWKAFNIHWIFCFAQQYSFLSLSSSFAIFHWATRCPSFLHKAGEMRKS